MQIEITDKINEDLLKRQRINFIIEFDGATPAIVEVRKLLSQKLDVDMSNLVVRRIYNEYGSRRAKGYAYVYNTKQDMLKTEPEFVKKKNKVGEEQPQEGKEKVEKSEQVEKPEQEAKEQQKESSQQQGN